MESRGGKQNGPEFFRFPAWLKQLAPVLGSALILYYYFHGQDWGKLRAAALQSNLWLAALAVLAPQLVYWWFMTATQKYHINWFHGPFPFREYFWVSGMVYILMFVNTALGGGGLLLYTQRKAGISWRKFAGILLFRLGLMLWGFAVILIPGTIAMHYLGLAQRAGKAIYVWWGFLIFGVLYLINGWMTWHHGRHAGLSRLVVRDRNSEFWTAFRVATKKQWFATWGLTIPPYLFTVLGLYFVAFAFDIRVPFVTFMTVGALMLLVMDLPIALGGFGSATLAWMLFFKDYGEPDAVKAMTLFFPFARSAARGLIGLVSLRPGLREINSLFASNKKI